MSDGDTKVTPEPIPFLKTKDLEKELAALRAKPDVKWADKFLVKILMSLSKGKADDPKRASAIALDVVTAGLHLPKEKAKARASL